MNKKRVGEARRWFQQANYDLQAARWNLEGGFYNTHSLVEMVKEATKTLIPLTDLVEEARRLDLHYIPSRYPNGLPSGYPHQFYSKAMAEEAVKAAEKIFSSIRTHYEAQGANEKRTSHCLRSQVCFHRILEKRRIDGIDGTDGKSGVRVSRNS